MQFGRIQFKLASGHANERGARLRSNSASACGLALNDCTELQPADRRFTPTGRWSRWRLWSLLFLIPMVCCGCGSGPTPESLARESAAQAAQATAVSQREADQAEEVAQPGDAGTQATEKNSLAELLLSASDRELLRSGSRTDTGVGPLPEIDDEQLAAGGIRKLEGKYLTLYTDVPSTFEVDEIPKVFDRAVPHWARYFEIPAEQFEDWKIVGYLILSKERFQAAGLFPGDLPPFLHGYQRGREIWVYDQPSDYYRRHLTMHEGVHAFMNQIVGGSGPPWYQEGMAELLATHLWEKRRLQVAYFPTSREKVPYWGRIKVIQDELAAGRGKQLREVMRLQHEDHRRLDAYAWSWAAAAFLNGHPTYRVGFRDLRNNVKDTTALFSREFEQRYSAKWREIDEEWQLFVVNLDYGYDLVRNSVQYAPGVPLPAGGRSAIITADRGWQSTGILLQAGKTYQVVSKGRFQVRKNPQAWWSEPGGITLRYHRGYPLGMLMGIVRPNSEAVEGGVSSLVRPFPVGLNRRFVVQNTGTLFLRINDSPGELIDNVGQITIKAMEYQRGDSKKTTSQGQTARARSTR